MFNLLPFAQTGIDFANELEYTESINTYTFKNFYNGGGVGLADFNNDSLTDIFFSGNLVSSRLYVNRGNMRFEDVTTSAGLETTGSWSTGVSIVDINADGLPDIYVCKSGPPGGERRHNELFINEGNLVFSEQSTEYGLDHTGLSTHAGFFDYDLDGDLDCYLLNNSLRSVGAYDLRKDQRKIPDPAGGNKLLRNDSGKFVDVTSSAGIYSSAIGFGLGVAFSDINSDGWPDIYVSNDFFEKDYLYINNGDGTFTESLEQMIREISLGSMGADIADINNDALPEIFVTEMLPESDDRLKTTTQFENWNKYVANVSQGYYHQFSRNVLQLNNGNGTFSEIGRYANVHASDWSWGALIFDMNNDSNKDIFVANGIYKDLLDQDYVNFVSDHNVVRQILREKGAVIKQLIDSIPVNKIANFAFVNDGAMKFDNRADEWGLGEPTHSNGSAYADLDNDGDLDLVLNNVNMPAFVYRNEARSIHPEHHYLSVSLHGEGQNVDAIGAKVLLKVAGQTLFQENFPSRGFMSSVESRLHFGLGKSTLVDTVIVHWPDGRVSRKVNVKADTGIHLFQSNAVKESPPGSVLIPAIFERLTTGVIPFIHRESEFVDFDRDRLLFNMISNEGPCMCVGDVNGDGREDVYIGGAKGQAGSLLIQRNSNRFSPISENMFDVDKSSEDTGCSFFDANGDGLLDLYVASGSNEYSASSTALLDRLYINRDGVHFEKSQQLLPASNRFESTSAVDAADFDMDGDEDLFVGVRVVPGLYGIPCNGYLLQNDGKGNFTDVTERLADGLKDLGMITAARWADVNGDQLTDLIVVGEWMPITVFLNEGGKRLVKSEAGTTGSSGWYHSLEVVDVNSDGHADIVAGNHGLNSMFKASADEPLTLYINDFDQNGSVEHILTRYHGGRPLPLVLRQDLVTQIPALKKKYLHYEQYRQQTVNDIFDDTQVRNAVRLQAFEMETAVWMNDGSGGFTKHSLPMEAQLTPVYAICVEDFDNDGNKDIVLGGNLRRAKPETGIYDAGLTTLLRGDGDGGFEAVSPQESGLSITGEVRKIKVLSSGSPRILVARNNDAIEIYSYKNAKVQ